MIVHRFSFNGSTINMVREVQSHLIVNFINDKT